MDDKHFAALTDISEYGAELQKRIDSYYEYMQESGFYQKIRQCYRKYYALDNKGTSLSSSSIKSRGEKGELKITKINHFRNLIKHQVILATGSRPALEAIAMNSDYESQTQAILANGIIEYYLREKDLEKLIKKAALMTHIFSESYITTSWDPLSGKLYDVGEGPVYQGDVKYNCYDPLRVIRNPYRESSDQDWSITLDFINKYDLIATFPQFEEKILQLATKNELFNDFYIGSERLKNDDVTFYKFRHRQTPAVPKGRYTEFCDADTIFRDGELPYREVYVRRLSAEDVFGTMMSYISSFDLLPVQEAIDLLHSTILTNQSAFGVQNVQGPRGANIQVTNIPGGLRYLEYDMAKGKLEPLQLTATPPEIFNYAKEMERTGETLSGINSVSRGDPAASLKSGAALALVQSMAIQFNSDFQNSYYKLMEEVGTDTLHVLQDFAKIPRVAMIVGKANAYTFKEFMKDDINKVDRVIFSVTNPLSKTTAGKVEIANTLLQSGLIKTPEQYIQVLTTGRIEPMIEGDQSELMNIRKENEMMGDGQQPNAVATDNHKMHIQEHKIVLSSPNSREDVKVLNVALAHITQHLDLMKTTDPALLLLTGQQPLPPQMLGQQGAPPPQQPGQPSGPPPDSSMAATGEPPPEASPPGTRMPSMPNNPLTGKNFNPHTGGL